MSSSWPFGYSMDECQALITIALAAASTGPQSVWSNDTVYAAAVFVCPVEQVFRPHLRQTADQRWRLVGAGTGGSRSLVPGAGQFAAVRGIEVAARSCRRGTRCSRRAPERGVQSTDALRRGSARDQPARDLEQALRIPDLLGNRQAGARAPGRRSAPPRRDPGRARSFSHARSPARVRAPTRACSAAAAGPRAR